MRCVGEPHARSEVVLVRLLLCAKGAGKGCAHEAHRRFGSVYGGKLQRVFRSAPVFVTQSEIESKILFYAPSILHVGSVVGRKRLNGGVSKEPRDGSAIAGEIVDIVGQASASEGFVASRVRSTRGSPRLWGGWADREGAPRIHGNAVLDGHQRHVSAELDGVLAKGQAEPILELAGLVIARGRLIA